MTQAESILVVDDGLTFQSLHTKALKRRNQKGIQKDFPLQGKNESLLQRLNFFMNKEKGKISRELEYYSKLAKLEPQNTKARLKMAELYQKQRDRRKAIDEYLQAAEIFREKNLFPQAMAVYKQVLKQNPGLDQVHIKIADIYRQMGLLGDAFYRYNLLLQQYNLLGEKEKALELMGLMAELEPQKFNLDENPAALKRISELSGQQTARAHYADVGNGEDVKAEPQKTFFDLGKALEAAGPVAMTGYAEIAMEKIYDFKEILQELKETAGPSKAYPNFNFHMGVACREMGFIDEAIEQLQYALEKEQNPFEAAKLLSGCLKEKGWWEESGRALEKSLQVEGVTEEKAEEVKRELEYINRELEREKQTLGCLNKVSSHLPEAAEMKKEMPDPEAFPRSKSTCLLAGAAQW